MEAIRESTSKQVKIKDSNSTKLAVDPNYIAYKKLIKTLNGGARKAHPSNNCLIEWNEVQVHCICCGYYAHIAQFKNLILPYNVGESHKELGGGIRQKLLSNLSTGEVASGRSNFDLSTGDTQ